MNSYFNSISNCCSNPFIVGLIIVFVLNLILMFISPRTKNGNISSKRLFRSSLYQYIIVTLILYVHHNRLINEYNQKYESNLKLDLVSKTGSSENMLEPEFSKDFKLPENLATEDDFV